jgi:hypothetical protein
VRKAADRHQDVSREASCGKGVDRHLFALYVVAMGLGKVKIAAPVLAVALRPKRPRYIFRVIDLVSVAARHVATCIEGDSVQVLYYMETDKEEFVVGRFPARAHVSYHNKKKLLNHWANI